MSGQQENCSIEDRVSIDINMLRQGQLCCCANSSLLSRVSNYPCIFHNLLSPSLKDQGKLSCHLLHSFLQEKFLLLKRFSTIKRLDTLTLCVNCRYIIISRLQNEVNHNSCLVIITWDHSEEVAKS